MEAISEIFELKIWCTQKVMEKSAEAIFWHFECLSLNMSQFGGQKIPQALANMQALAVRVYVYLFIW